MRYRCCDLGDSSYCPENRREICKNRILYRLNPEGGNEERIRIVNEGGISRDDCSKEMQVLRS